MKKLLALVALTIGLTLTVSAQTNTPPTATGIGTEALGWLTSFNTNSTTFEQNSGAFFTSVISEQKGVAPLLNEIGGLYDLKTLSAYNPTNGHKVTLFLEGRERNTGVSGTISSAQSGLGLALSVWDVRIEVSVDGGYNLERAVGQDKFYGEVDFTVLKALAAHYAIGVGTFIDFPSYVPGLFAEVRACF